MRVTSLISTPLTRKSGPFVLKVRLPKPPCGSKNDTSAFFQSSWYTAPLNCKRRPSHSLFQPISLLVNVSGEYVAGVKYCLMPFASGRCDDTPRLNPPGRKPWDHV